MAPRIPASLISSRLLVTRVAATPASVTASRNQSTVHDGHVQKDPQIGEYPNLPHLSAQERSPFGWDDNQDRRNFEEPVSSFEKSLMCCIQSTLSMSHGCWRMEFGIDSEFDKIV